VRGQGKFVMAVAYSPCGKIIAAGLPKEPYFKRALEQYLPSSLSLSRHRVLFVTHRALFFGKPGSCHAWPKPPFSGTPRVSIKEPYPTQIETLSHVRTSGAQDGCVSLIDSASGNLIRKIEG